MIPHLISEMQNGRGQVHVSWANHWWPCDQNTFCQMPKLQVQLGSLACRLGQSKCRNPKISRQFSILRRGRTMMYMNLYPIVAHNIGWRCRETRFTTCLQDLKGFAFQFLAARSRKHPKQPSNILEIYQNLHNQNILYQSERGNSKTRRDPKNTEAWATARARQEINLWLSAHSGEKCRNFELFKHVYFG